MNENEMRQVTRVRQMCRSGEAERLRRRARLSLMECGEILGCSPATIMRWEKGERLPRWDNALLYAAFLGTLESITHAA